ncbi:MAG: biotin--[acetyl-CoA-carboxylase] ligase [Acidobacteria bacterium]|nr:biotin--[acetyl-CoA-carboxylase] ligase [Acidobacteriota bacterium]
MTRTFDPLPGDLASAIARDAERLGRFARLHFLAETASTNDVALALALEGAPEGTAVMADEQRAGRGRRGHEWFSPAGAGVYLSVVVRPSGSRGAPPLVTLAAGVAAASAVRNTTALPAELKWPNDVVIGRPWRKLGGILTEASGTGDRVDAVVIGIGLNLLKASYPMELADRATSIEMELGRPVERAPLVVALLEALRVEIDRLHAEDHESIRRAWRALARAGLSGAPVRWRERGELRHGRARDIDADGALLVEAHGTLERVIGGDVHWDGLSRD